MVTIEGCMIVNVMTIACGDQLGIPLSTRLALLTLSSPLLSNKLHSCQNGTAAHAQTVRVEKLHRGTVE